MGISVNIELRNVKFKKKDTKKVLKALKDLNNSLLIPKNRYGRFNPDLNDLIEIFEELRYELIKEDDHYVVSEFVGNNLGEDEKIWEVLSPFLSDCEIIYDRDDGISLKQVVQNGKIILTDND